LCNFKKSIILLIAKIIYTKKLLNVNTIIIEISIILFKTQ
jgi:hypothetical protein